MNTRLLVLLTLVVPHIAFSQGALNPPGPPAPTMKTLDQVEARTPVDAAHLATDDENHFIIDRAGSYYLTGNIAVSKTNGVRIRSAGVTLDLNGFEIARSAGTGGAGVVVDDTAHRCTIKNGSLTGFNNGVASTGPPPAKGGMCLQLAISGCAGSGILAGDGWLIDGCKLHDNGRAIETGSSSTIQNSVATKNVTGIIARAGCTVTNCTASENSAVGIYVETGSSVIGCTARGNGVDGIRATEVNCTITDTTASENGAIGIVAGDAANIQRCSASSNRGFAGIAVIDRAQVVDCVADSNGTGAGGIGIRGGIRTVVKRCTATENRFDGISVAGESVVTENRASRNGRGSPAAGIRTTNASGSGSRVEANHTRDNTGVGIKASGADVVIRNSAGNNIPGPNYQDPDVAPLSGPNVGPIGNLTTTSSNPFANLQ